MPGQADFESVLSFWFEELSPEQWWAKDPNFDAECARRFGTLHDAAIRGELFGWRAVPAGRLAEIILLDQLSRNIYRDRPKTFAFDPLALVLAQAAVQTGDDLQIDTQRRSFVYMPYMHSESSVIQAESVPSFCESGQCKDARFRHAAQGHHRPLWSLSAPQCPPWPGVDRRRDRVS